MKEVIEWTPMETDVDGVAYAGTAADGAIIVAYEDGTAIVAYPDGTQVEMPWYE